MTVLSFRQQLTRRYRKYRNILALTNGLQTSQRRLVDKTSEQIAQLFASRLRAMANEIDEALQRVSEHYGLVGRLDEMDNILSSSQTHGMGPNHLLCVSKFHLAEVFKHYERTLPVFPKLPLHARVGIDVGNIRDSAAEMEVFQLEASLFEDMASLWNDAVKADLIADGSGANSMQIKHAHACLRATAKAAFNLLEGFLNGLAGDVVLLRTVSAKDRTKLTEWDEEWQKPLFLSLREKLLQYPKIATGAEHPLLQESSCPAMHRALRLEKSLRQALIHPRPQIMPADLESFREAAFYELKLDEVAVLCDDVIELIFLISFNVGPNFGDVSLWLVRRQSDGIFSEETFS